MSLQKFFPPAVIPARPFLHFTVTAEMPPASAGQPGDGAGDRSAKNFRVIAGRPPRQETNYRRNRQTRNKRHSPTSYRNSLVMKATIVSILLAGLTLTTALHAQVPHTLSYQGQLAVNGNGFNGPGQFKFALVSASGGTTFWSNDGTSAGGSEPTNAVAVTVDKGFYSVLLGDTNLSNMTSIPYTAFGNSDVHLRIWFNDGNNGFQQLTPDQLIASVGYAMMAADVHDGAITESKLANGAVTSGKIAANAIGAVQIALAAGAVGSTQLADDLDLGSAAVNGRLDVFHTAAGTPSISLNGAGNTISVFGNDGSELSRMWGINWGEVYLQDSVGHETAARLTANGNAGGRLYLYNSNGLTRALVSGENVGGLVTLYQADGSGAGASLDGNNSYGAGQLTLYQADGNPGAVLYGDEGTGYGALSLRNAAGNPRVRLYGGATSGSMAIYDASGTETFQVLGAATGNTGSELRMRNSAGNTTIEMDGEWTPANGGTIRLLKADGTETIRLQADYNGDGRIITQVLQITGGSDLSERFEIKSTDATLHPGMLVSIDPENPGQLILSTRAYDRTAAGVISGAGGVNPGMVMGQTGSIADGKHPVALTGRVYCQVDASYAAIRPGDLITTSDTPGHGMKVTDHAKAQGAIIGKALTGLDAGKGLVLVLVGLQ